ncbi:MAG: GYD domain-containing protein [Thermodesulfobacteriota bacterium]
MATYVILSRISPLAFDDPKDFPRIAKTVSEKIKKECPGVTWKESFVTYGRFDVVDIVESDDPDQVGKAAMIIRAYGKSETETMLATPWKEFLKTLGS